MRESHYPIVGQILLETLEETLGATFTAEAKSAWAGFYGVVAASMMAGARDVSQTAGMPATAGT